MSGATEFIIGSKVACSDGACGDLRRVVIDPVARAITHLVVEPRHLRGQGRLVPIERVASTGTEIRLLCTKAQFGVLEEAEETEFLPGASRDWGYEQDQMLSLPYFRLGSMGIAGVVGVGAGGMGVPHMDAAGMGVHTRAISTDRVPAGEVDVRRGEHVHATDGAIGRVRGLVIDPNDHHVTHVLLDEGHLWGQKRVAIPIGAVTRVDDGVRLNLTKDEVRDLPPVDVDHPS
jgi:sporulation protein YlmC with PRC-barrel domain